ncbi:MAG: hypothetical protein JNK45_28055 [Myxococcales bacterium]|nr:hypothetical protein [Myxococcales bacterium]
MSSVSGPSSAPPPRTYEGAMLRKVKEQTEIQGAAMLKLVESAASSGHPEGTATMIDDVA